MMRIVLAIALVVVYALSAFGQGGAPSPPFNGWWDARWSGLKTNDSVTDQTAVLSAAKLKAKTLGWSLFVPKGVYNAGLTLDSTYDRFSIILGGDVKIKQAWHFAGNGRDLDIGDANYSTTTSTNGDNYVTDVTISGGRLILGTGGRLGTFYAKRINIESPIYGEALCAGVHVYSHTHGITFSSMWFDGTGSVSSYEAPFWADPFSASADSSQPSDIYIGDYHVVSAYRYGLNLSARNVHIGRAYIQGAAFNGLRFYSAITNAGTVDTCRASNLTIDQLTVRNCGGTGSGTNDHLYAGVLIDSYANDVGIGFMDIAGCAENALKIYNSAHNVNIDWLRADSNQTNTTDNPTTRYAVHISGTTTRNVNIGDAFIRYAPPAAGSNVGATGLAIDGARDVTIGKVVVRDGFKTGVLVNNAYQNVHIGQIIAKLDTNGVAVSGDNLGPLVIDDIATDSCYTYGMFLGGTSVGNVIRIGTALFNGRHISGSSDAGINVNSIAGSVKFDRLQVRNYATGATGVLVQGNCTGDFTVDELVLDSNAIGIDWSKGTAPSTENNKFTFGKVTAFGNTANWDSDFRTDRLLNIGTIEGGAAADTSMLCGYPVNLGGSAPTNAYILKFDGTDSTWKPQVDAGGASDGSGIWDSTVVAPNRDTAVVKMSASDTLVAIRSKSATTTEMFTDQDGRTGGFEFLSPVSMGSVKFKSLYLNPPAPGTVNSIIVGDSVSGARLYYKTTVAPDSAIPPLGKVRSTINDTLAVRLPVPLTVPLGGTGLTTATDGGILLGNGTGAVTPMAVLGNGALVVGDGTTDPTTLSMGTSLQQLRVNSGATALEWATISGGSGQWTGADASDVQLIVPTNDTALRITTGSNITTLATDLTIPRSLVLSSNGGITLSGGSVINTFVDSTEVENAAGTGRGWLLSRFAAGDSGRILWSPAQSGFTDTDNNNKFLKFYKVGSTTAPDTVGFALVDLTASVTGVLPAANGGTGSAMTNGQLLIGDGSGVPTIASISNGTGTTVNNGAGTISIDATLGTSVALTTEVTGVLPIANGGTNNSGALTDGGLLLGGSSITALGVATNGQIPIGDGTTAPVLATISNGTGTTVTNGAGTIAINATLGTSVDLASEITGLLPLVNITAGTDGQVIKMSGTTVGWGTDATGGGGSSQFIKTVDTNSAGTTAISMADSIHVDDSGGIDIAGQNITNNTDTLTFSIADGGVTSAKIANGTVAIGDMVSTFPYIYGVYNNGGGGTSATHPVYFRPWGGLSSVFFTAPGTIDTARLYVNADHSTLDTSGTGNTLQVKDSGISLTGGKVSGVLPVSHGGTGAATFTANNVLLGNGTSAFQVVAPGTTGNVLTSNGTTWLSSAPAGGGAGIGFTEVDGTTINGATGVNMTALNGINTSVDVSGATDLVKLYIDVDGVTMDTAAGAGGDLKVKDGGIGLTQAGNTLPYVHANTSGTVATFDERVDFSSSGSIQLTGSNTASPNTLAFDIATNGIVNIMLQDNVVSNAEMADNAIGNAEMADAAIGGAEMLYRYVEYDLPIVGSRNQNITDSLTLSLPNFGSDIGTFNDSIGMTTLFIDSSSQGSDVDQVMVWGTIPEDILADSVKFSFRTCLSNLGTSTGTECKIDSVAWRYRSASSDGVQQNMAATGSSTTDRSSATWTTATYTLSGATIVAGSIFKFMFANALTSAQTSVHVGYVHVCGRRR